MTFGLPPLLGKISKVSNPIALLVADAKLISGMFAEPKWGIYLDGKLALKPDSIVGLDFKIDWRIAEYPMEGGAFQSYNKVMTPFDIRIQMTKGGTDADRQAFLSEVEAAAASMILYDVLMPEWGYTSCSISHIDYRRTSAGGVGLLTVDLWLTKVRATATAKFSNTKSPNGADPVNGGNVQAQPASSAQASSAKAAT
jgi:hypothetical protein